MGCPAAVDVVGTAAGAFWCAVEAVVAAAAALAACGTASGVADAAVPVVVSAAPTGLAAGAAAFASDTSVAALGEDLGAAEGSPAAITCTQRLGSELQM